MSRAPLSSADSIRYNAQRGSVGQVSPVRNMEGRVEEWWRSGLADGSMERSNGRWRGYSRDSTRVVGAEAARAVAASKNATDETDETDDG